MYIYIYFHSYYMYTYTYICKPMFYPYIRIHIFLYTVNA